MNKKLNLRTLSKTETPSQRKFKVYVIIFLILIFQFGIVFVFNYNDKLIYEKGTLYKIKIDSAEVDYINDKITVEFNKLETKEQGIMELGELSYDINDMEGFYYNVTKDSHGLAYLVDTDLNKRKEKDFLQVTTGTKNYFERPDFYLKGDKLKPINTGTSNGLGYLNIEADVIVYKGAYIIQEIYINRIPYEKFIEDNYFDLLDVESSE